MRHTYAKWQQTRKPAPPPPSFVDNNPFRISYHQIAVCYRHGESFCFKLLGVEDNPYGSMYNIELEHKESGRIFIVKALSQRSHYYNNFQVIESQYVTEYLKYA